MPKRTTPPSEVREALIQDAMRLLAAKSASVKHFLNPFGRRGKSSVKSSKVYRRIAEAQVDHQGEFDRILRALVARGSTAQINLLFARIYDHADKYSEPDLTGILIAIEREPKGQCFEAFRVAFHEIMSNYPAYKASMTDTEWNYEEDVKKRLPEFLAAFQDHQEAKDALAAAEKKAAELRRRVAELNKAKHKHDMFSERGAVATKHTKGDHLSGPGLGPK